MTAIIRFRDHDVGNYSGPSGTLDDAGRLGALM